MTVRSLFNIILKVIGIFVMKDFLAIIPELISISVFMTKPDSAGEAILTLGTTIAVLFVWGLLSYFLIFKSNFIIDKLKLDKGFDQEIISLNIHRATVLSISIIVIGGLLIANEIPNFCGQLYGYYQEKRITHGLTNPDISQSIPTVTKIIIGLLLIVYQRQIVNFIERKRKS